MHVETDRFTVTVLEHAYSESSGLSKRPPTWLGVQRAAITCRSCGAAWEHDGDATMAGALGHIEVECVSCDAAEMIPAARFRA
ncbi:hypothetical protein [[Pseudomonas] boreopolis]|uniref:Uncharacterized protein n=1 Tax=Xanthomonas boreopolis TaxID=86183 RepID=A0A919KHY0_9XANT|nr:hypothetical protein GCM10009090_16730 [[Pseudomonas] boreopolis]